jgi:short-subunit dehydrogenase
MLNGQESYHARVQRNACTQQGVVMKLSVITGASSGIGAATARRMAADGYKVVLLARGRSKLDEVAAEIGNNAVVEVCDASDGDAVLAIAERVRDDFGVPDVIVNCAGAGQWKLIEDTPPAEGMAMMQAPYFAAFNLTHAFMRDMLGRNRGVIIHVGAAVSIFTFPSCTGYAAARWALRGLHESLCEDLHGTGVRSCHVVFGKVSSPYFDHNPGVEEKIPGIARTVRTISPEECAKVIATAAKRPQRQVVYPLMLRMFVWSYALLPWVTRWLLRTTGAKRQVQTPSS